MTTGRYFLQIEDTPNNWLTADHFDNPDAAVEEWKAARERTRDIDPFFPVRILDTRPEGTLGKPRIIRSSVALRTV